MICLRAPLKILALLVRRLGALLGYIVNMVGSRTSLKTVKFYSYTMFVRSMWFMPILSTFRAPR